MVVTIIIGVLIGLCTFFLMIGTVSLLLSFFITKVSVSFCAVTTANVFVNKSKLQIINLIEYIRVDFLVCCSKKNYGKF